MRGRAAGSVLATLPQLLGLLAPPWVAPMLAAACRNNAAAYNPIYDVAPPFGNPIDILDIIAVAEYWGNVYQ